MLNQKFKEQRKKYISNSEMHNLKIFIQEPLQTSLNLSPTLRMRKGFSLD